MTKTNEKIDTIIEMNKHLTRNQEDCLLAIKEAETVQELIDVHMDFCRAFTVGDWNPLYNLINEKKNEISGQGIGGQK